MWLDVGGFTMRRRLWLAWVDIRNWYGVALAICVVAIVALALSTDSLFVWAFWDMLVSVVYALANGYAVRAVAPSFFLRDPTRLRAHVGWLRVRSPLRR